MSEDVSGWTATKRLKHNILKPAFSQHKGAEAILMIQWCLAQGRHKNEICAAAYKIDWSALLQSPTNGGKPLSINGWM